MKLFKNKFIAHRGFHNSTSIPENSLVAFEKAIDKNYAIEFDITITKDDKVIVFHDDDLLRLCNIKENVEESTYLSLKKLKLYSSDEYIPLFEEVLTLVKGRVPLIIEIKKHKNIGILESIVVDLLENYNGEYFICSFEKDILFWFRENKSNLKRGLIFESNLKKFVKYNKVLFLYKYFKIKPDFVSLDYKILDSSIYQFCKINKVPLLSWTINNTEEYEKIIEKVNAVIFENIIL